VSDTARQLDEALAGRYRIERELGAGGMATVYLAHDLKHDRKVAIKVLRPELAAVIGAERFLAEIKTTSNLQHPHILPLFDSGIAPVEGHGIATCLYYVMPFVEGESLRDRLTREKQLPIPDAVRIASEVAAALDYAHRRGVIHRDIKPENILLHEGSALVADFGIALALSGAGSTRMTETGMSLGTPHYMSPEQAMGEREITGRSDVYALGCVTYEMLIGEPPFTGPTAQAIIARVMTAEPARLTAQRKSIAPPIEAAVLTALARVPADRFGTAAEYAAALRGESPGSTTAIGPAGLAPVRGTRRRLLAGLAAAAALLLVALGMVWMLRHRGGQSETSERERRLVVLPFENQGDTSRQYFANGVTEAITTELTGIGGMSVIPRSTAARYRGTSKSVSEIGRELGVGYVLTGTVQWDLSGGKDPKVRVSPELIRVSDTSSVWAHGYEAVMSSVFTVYSDVSTAVAKALQVTLKEPERQALARRPTTNPEAYDLYLRAIDYNNRGLARENFNAAIPMLERAVQLDPEFALAWGRLSETLGLAHWLYIIHSDATMARARAAAETALRLQPDLPEAHRAMGYYFYRQRRYQDALREFAIVQQSQPNSADLISAIAFVERREGKWAEAVEHLRRSMELDPGAATTISQLCETLGFLGRYEEAIETCRRGIEVAPDQPDAYYFLSLALLSQRGDVAGAADVYRAALQHMPPARLIIGTTRVAAFSVARDDSLSRAFLVSPPNAVSQDIAFGYAFRADILRLRGRTAEAAAVYDSARVILEGALREMPDDYGYHRDLGLVLARQGKFEAAVREGRRAVELLPPERDAYFGVDNVQNLARIYALAGQAGPVVEQLQSLKGRPSRLTAAMIRVDPDWDRIRQDPAFERLVAPR
jgi:serine/threonine-protein kinase